MPNMIVNLHLEQLFHKSGKQDQEDTYSQNITIKLH